MMKKWLEKILEITKTLMSRVWEKFKVFWFTIARAVAQKPHSQESDDAPRHRFCCRHSLYRTHVLHSLLRPAHGRVAQGLQAEPGHAHPRRGRQGAGPGEDRERHLRAASADPEVHGERASRDRGPALLPAQGHRLPRYHACGAQGHYIGTAEAGRQHYHAAANEGGVPLAGAEVHAQDQGNHPRAAA